MSTEQKLARQITTFFAAATVGLVGLFFLASLMGQALVMVMLYSAVAAVACLVCSVGSGMAWVILAARGITRSPPSNSAAENGRAEGPRAVRRER